MDVLDGLEEIKMCISYELGGKKIDHLPAASEQQQKVKPLYKRYSNHRFDTNINIFHLKLYCWKHRANTRMCSNFRELG